MNDHDATATELVDAGVRTLLRAPRDVLDRGLRSEDVVNDAGSSQATFFRKFSKKTEFIDAVVQSLTDTEWLSADAVRLAVGTHFRANGNAVRPTVIALVNDYLEVLLNEESTEKDLLGHAFGNHRDVKSHYVRRDELVSVAFEALFEHSDAALRRPFASRTFALTVNAVLDGLRLRSRVERNSVSAELVSDILLALLGAIVDTSGTHQHLDDLVGPIEPATTRQPVPRDPRAAIIAAARDQLGKRGYFMTRTDDIADAAAVPRSALTKLFPTKPHIIVAALQARVNTLRESVADDLLIGLDEIVIIENFLLRCAQLAADEMVFMDAMLVAVAHDTYGEPEGVLSIKEKLNIPAIIAPVIQQGQDNGVLAVFGSPFDLAAGITNTLLMRCFTRRANSAEDNAEFIGNLLLSGLAERNGPSQTRLDGSS